MASDTKTRIQQVALELFTAQGIQRTSLQQIADRLGMTKPALYYHFASRQDLVHSLIQPMIQDVEDLITRTEKADAVAHLTLLGDYFDVMYQHRDITRMIARDLSALADSDFGTMATSWQSRITRLLVGPAPALEDHTKAVVAVGGLADCTVQFAHVPAAELRSAALAAACATLGLEPPGRRAALPA